MEVFEVLHRRQVELRLVRVVLLLEPRVLVALLSRWPLCRVKRQHLIEQIFGIVRHNLESRVGHAVLSLLHPGQNFPVVSAIERRGACQHDIENHAQTPHITLRVVVSLENLRSDVVRLAV